MTTRTRTDVLLLAGFCAFLFFYGLGQFGLVGADEPRYAQVAREMLQRRDWITPVLGGQPWLEKPPLYYWQAMLAYSLYGVSDAAARAPSALNATLLVIAVYLFLRRFRPGVELDGALITASCAGVIGYARAAGTDMALASAFSIAMLSWWGWRESGKTSLSRGVLCIHGSGHAGQRAGRALSRRFGHCVLCRGRAGIQDNCADSLAAGHRDFLRDFLALVFRCADAQSRVFPCILSATQPGAIFQQSLSPSRAVLVLPSGNLVGPDAVGGFCDGGVGGVGTSLVGGEIDERLRRTRTANSSFDFFCCCG